MAGDVAARKAPLNKAIVESDAALFNASLPGWLEITNYILGQRAGRLKATEDGSIPFLSEADYTSRSLLTVADDSVFAFAIAAALNGKARALADIDLGLAERYGTHYPGSDALQFFRAPRQNPETLDDHIGLIGDLIAQDEQLGPRDTWIVCMRLLQKSRGSNFNAELTPLLSRFCRHRWNVLLAQQPDAQASDLATKEALNDPRDDESFIAEVLLAALPSLDLKLDEDDLALLTSAAQRI